MFRKFFLFLNSATRFASGDFSQLVLKQLRNNHSTLTIRDSKGPKRINKWKNYQCLYLTNQKHFIWSQTQERFSSTKNAFTFKAYRIFRSLIPNVVIIEPMKIFLHEKRIDFQKPFKFLNAKCVTLCAFLLSNPVSNTH